MNHKLVPIAVLIMSIILLISCAPGNVANTTPALTKVPFQPKPIDVNEAKATFLDKYHNVVQKYPSNVATILRQYKMGILDLEGVTPGSVTRFLFKYKDGKEQKKSSNKGVYKYATIWLYTGNETNKAIISYEKASNGNYMLTYEKGNLCAGLADNIQFGDQDMVAQLGVLGFAPFSFKPDPVCSQMILYHSGEKVKETEEFISAMVSLFSNVRLKEF